MAKLGTHKPNFHHSRGTRKNLGMVTAKLLVSREQYKLLIAEATKRDCTLAELIEFHAAKSLDSIINPHAHGTSSPPTLDMGTQLA